jgi:uncharacterized protein YicC (UPF0701 family)
MQNETFNGKKLGFISQEIGREINTLGLLKPITTKSKNW